MVDVVDSATRSRMMSGIRGKNTKPELQVRSFLHRQGLRFRLHGALLGKPDIVLPKYHAVVFVHGCFWHRHRGCKYAATPSTNRQFWQAKFKENVKRDKKVRSELRKLGWRTFVVWECSITVAALTVLVNQIKSGAADGASV